MSIDILSNILINNITKNISLEELQNEIILYLIENHEKADDLCKKFARNIFITNKWDIEQIYQFLNLCRNKFNNLNELQIDIIEDAFKDIHFTFHKKNKKGETLLDIIKK